MTFAATAAAAPPTVTNLGSSVRNHEAHVRFLVDAGDSDANVAVEYWIAPDNVGDAHYALSADAGAGPTQLEFRLWDLRAGQTYHYRAVATNADDTDEGAVADFTTTDEAEPVPVTGEASDLTASGAVLNGTVDPEGHAITSCTFRWVTQSTFEWKGFMDYGGQFPVYHVLPCSQSPASLGSGDGPVPVSAPLTGLAPDRYHFLLAVEGEFSDFVRGEAIAEFVVPAPAASEPSPAVDPTPPGGDSVATGEGGATSLRTGHRKTRKRHHRHHHHSHRQHRR